MPALVGSLATLVVGAIAYAVGYHSGKKDAVTAKK